MQPKSETLAVGVCNYGFSLPEKIGTSNEYCSDSDVALITVGDILYLAYKEKNKQTIRLITGMGVL
jgi:hypothetical protein